MQTRNGVELNISESKYITYYKDFKFYFSSMFYKKKFETRMNEFIELETQKIIAKYKVNITIDIYLLISLYKRIEKRGFFILTPENNEIKENIVFYTKV